MTTKKRKITEQLKHDANHPKSDLIRIARKMEAEGLKKEADRLGSVIGYLEHWQNSG